MVSRRLLVALVAFVAALAFAGGASAYGWPVRPFDRPHPIRGGFGDPRTVFTLGFFSDPWAGPGTFSFHNGIDISARADTPVYPVTSGIAHLRSAGQVEVESPLLNATRRVFQYEHITPHVREGQHVVARKTILGLVQATAGHVHLTEIDGFRVVNPLLKGHLAPYRDRTRPSVAEILLTRPANGAEVGSAAVCGRIALSAEAFDRPVLPAPQPWTGLPIAPALVTWKLTKLDGTVLVPSTTAADFRTTVPPNPQFWTVYARGTYQNAPRFGLQQFGGLPGRFLYVLSPMLDTRTLPNGVALVTVGVKDERGNTGGLSQRIFVYNNPRGAACPEPRPPVTTTTTTTTTTTSGP
ncbi:MAG: Peptidase family [Gaiellaceae bacterium]|nr:Peptidase family [Gaiellaceae bacterium]